MFKNSCSSQGQCIHCSVQQCRHHAGNENLCTLSSINVGTHEANPTDMQCTDCQSFEMK